MTQKKATLVILMVSIFAFCAGCTAAMADDPAVSHAKIQIYGKISVKGSEPHTYLCLSTDSGTDYRLEGELKDLIRARYQQERIRIEGVITHQAIGPGYPAVFRVYRIILP